MFSYISHFIGIDVPETITDSVTNRTTNLYKPQRNRTFSDVNANDNLRTFDGKADESNSLLKANNSSKYARMNEQNKSSPTKHHLFQKSWRYLVKSLVESLKHQINFNATSPDRDHFLERMKYFDKVLHFSNNRNQIMISDPMSRLARPQASIVKFRHRYRRRTPHRCDPDVVVPLVVYVGQEVKLQCKKW